MQVPEFIRQNACETIQTQDIQYVWRSLFNSYDAKYIRTDALRINREYTVGFGSHKAVGRITFNETNTDVRVKVGRMCNFAEHALILPDGEHLNANVINISISDMPDVYKRLISQGHYLPSATSKGVTEISDNVLVCENATILSGVKIGSGAVIGAAAVVTKDIPPFAIAVGTPARVIGYRFDEQTIEKLLKIRWWDFEHSYLFDNLCNIQRMKTDAFIEKYSDIDSNSYSKQGNRFVFTITGKDRLSCVGCEINNKFIPLDKLDQTIQFYIRQFEGCTDKPVHLVKNIFDCLS